MQINLDLLFSRGGIVKEYKKGEIVFNEGETAQYFHQIIDGQVRMYNVNEDGKEFTQGFFSNGQSFGEPPLFIDKEFPSTAIACKNCTIIKIPKEKFLKIIDEYPSIQKEFLSLLALKIHAKTKSLKSIINERPESRILSFLKSHKSFESQKRELVPFTRQEIANFTGLRVETVIREICKLNKAQKVEIINHKLFY